MDSYIIASYGLLSLFLIYSSYKSGYSKGTWDTKEFYTWSHKDMLRHYRDEIDNFRAKQCERCKYYLSSVTTKIGEKE